MANPVLCIAGRRLPGRLPAASSGVQRRPAASSGVQRRPAITCHVHGGLRHLLNKNKEVKAAPSNVRVVQMYEWYKCTSGSRRLLKKSKAEGTC